MPKIIDKSGREWLFDLTVDDLQRIQKATGVNVVLECTELARDPLKLALVVWEAVEPQATKRGIDSKSFYDGIGVEGSAGSFLEDAANALVECAVNFYPTNKRQAILTAYKTSERIISSVLDKMSDKASDPDLEAAIVSKVEEMLNRVTGVFGEPSTASRAASE
jgi:hypothetical protein